MVLTRADATFQSYFIPDNIQASIFLPYTCEQNQLTDRVIDLNLIAAFNKVYKMEV